MSHVQLFLSAVTDEFRSCRDELRHELQRPNVTAQVQEDFIATGTETLDKLDAYISDCDAVIHLVGDMPGVCAGPETLRALKSRYPDLADRLSALQPSIEGNQPALSYTQWEAYLAVYHAKPLLIAVPTARARRDSEFRPDSSGQASQREHLARLRSMGRYPEIKFANTDQLAGRILRSTVLDLLVKAAASPSKPIALPYPSLGTLFKGRAAFMAELRNSLQRTTEGGATAIVGKALHGLGGIGKTRLAVEYAWQHRDHYSALLFIVADSPEDLRRNFAALVGPLVLNLPEQDAKEEEKRVAAALRWLQQNRQWFLIIDNVDTPAAAAAVEGLLAQLHGGEVLITSRLSNWSGVVERLELDVLGLEAATSFLLDRTAGRRRRAASDATDAGNLAQELGQLALALEQAGAYIDKHRLTFAQYRDEWQASRDKVMAWFDPQLMLYPRSIAATWQTSIDHLAESSRLLLDRLSWLSSEAIPDTLLDVPVPGAGETTESARAALADLEAYSLVTRASAASTFTVHPLVQEVTRGRSGTRPASLVAQARAWGRGLFGSPPRTSTTALVETLRWIDDAFTGHPGNVRSWPTLDPLMPHVRAVVEHADAAGISRPTASLMGRLGLLLRIKARYAEAEPLFKRALAIREQTLPAGDPDIAASLSHLGSLYFAQDQMSVAEPFFKRALAIREQAHHPDAASSRRRLALLYRAQGRTQEAKSLWGRTRRVSVFVSAPADATSERERVIRAIQSANDQFANSGVELEELHGETRYFTARGSFQVQLPEAAQSEIVVAIFRGRLGTPLPPDFPPMATGEVYPSLTAYDVLSGIEAHRARGFPDVFVFRSGAPPRVRLDDASWSEIETEWQRLEAFFETWFRSPDGHFTAAFQTFNSTDDFEALIERTLIQWLQNHGFHEDIARTADVAG